MVPNICHVCGVKLERSSFEVHISKHWKENPALTRRFDDLLEEIVRKGKKSTSDAASQLVVLVKDDTTRRVRLCLDALCSIPIERPTSRTWGSVVTTLLNACESSDVSVSSRRRHPVDVLCELILFLEDDVAPPLPRLASVYPRLMRFLDRSLHKKLGSGSPTTDRLFRILESLLSSRHYTVHDAEETLALFTAYSEDCEDPSTSVRCLKAMLAFCRSYDGPAECWFPTFSNALAKFEGRSNQEMDAMILEALVVVLLRCGVNMRPHLLWILDKFERLILARWRSRRLKGLLSLLLQPLFLAWKDMPDLHRAQVRLAGKLKKVICSEDVFEGLETFDRSAGIQTIPGRIPHIKYYYLKILIEALSTQHSTPDPEEMSCSPAKRRRLERSRMDVPLEEMILATLEECDRLTQGFDKVKQAMQLLAVLLFDDAPLLTAEFCSHVLKQIIRCNEQCVGLSQRPDIRGWMLCCCTGLLHRVSVKELQRDVEELWNFVVGQLPFAKDDALIDIMYVLIGRISCLDTIPRAALKSTIGDILHTPRHKSNFGICVFPMLARCSFEDEATSKNGDLCLSDIIKTLVSRLVNASSEPCRCQSTTCTQSCSWVIPLCLLAAVNGHFNSDPSRYFCSEATSFAFGDSTCPIREWDMQLVNNCLQSMQHWSKVVSAFPHVLPCEDPTRGDSVHWSCILPVSVSSLSPAASLGFRREMLRHILTSFVEEIQATKDLAAGLRVATRFFCFLAGAFVEISEELDSQNKCFVNFYDVVGSDLTQQICSSVESVVVSVISTWKGGVASNVISDVVDFCLVCSTLPETVVYSWSFHRIPSSLSKLESLLRQKMVVVLQLLHPHGDNSGNVVSVDVDDDVIDIGDDVLVAGDDGKMSAVSHLDEECSRVQGLSCFLCGLFRCPWAVMKDESDARVGKVLDTLLASVGDGGFFRKEAWDMLCSGVIALKPFLNDSGKEHILKSVYRTLLEENLEHPSDFIVVSLIRILRCCLSKDSSYAIHLWNYMQNSCFKELRCFSWDIKIFLAEAASNLLSGAGLTSTDRNGIVDLQQDLLGDADRRTRMFTRDLFSRSDVGTLDSFFNHASPSSACWSDVWTRALLLWKASSLECRQFSQLLHDYQDREDLQGSIFYFVGRVSESAGFDSISAYFAFLLGDMLHYWFRASEEVHIASFHDIPLAILMGESTTNPISVSSFVKQNLSAFLAAAVYYRQADLFESLLAILDTAPATLFSSNFPMVFAWYLTLPDRNHIQSAEAFIAASVGVSLDAFKQQYRRKWLSGREEDVLYCILDLVPTTEAGLGNGGEGSNTATPDSLMKALKRWKSVCYHGDAGRGVFIRHLIRVQKALHRSPHQSNHRRVLRSLLVFVEEFGDDFEPLCIRQCIGLVSHTVRAVSCARDRATCFIVLIKLCACRRSCLPILKPQLNELCYISRCILSNPRSSAEERDSASSLLVQLFCGTFTSVDDQARAFWEVDDRDFRDVAVVEKALQANRLQKGLQDEIDLFIGRTDGLFLRIHENIGSDGFIDSDEPTTTTNTANIENTTKTTNTANTTFTIPRWKALKSWLLRLKRVLSSDAKCDDIGSHSLAIRRLTYIISTVSSKAVYELAVDCLASLSVDPQCEYLDGIREEGLELFDSFSSDEKSIQASIFSFLLEYVVDNRAEVVRCAFLSLSRMLALPTARSVFGNIPNGLKVFLKGLDVGPEEKYMETEGSGRHEGVRYWKLGSESYEKWVCSLCSWLLDKIPEKNVLTACLELSRLKAGLSHHIFPELVFCLLNALDSWRKNLTNMLDESVMKNTAAPRAALELVLRTVRYLSYRRLEEITKSSNACSETFSTWQTPFGLDLDLLALAQAALKCGQPSYSLLFVETWCEKEQGRMCLPEITGFPEESPMYEKILVTSYQRLGDRDGIDGVLRSYGLLSRIPGYTEHGRWDQALTLYDQVLENDSALDERRLFSLVEGMRTCFRMLGYRHVSKVYAEGIRYVRPSLSDFAESAANNLSQWAPIPHPASELSGTALDSNGRFQQLLRILRDGDAMRFIRLKNFARYELMTKLRETEFVCSDISGLLSQLRMTHDLGDAWRARWKMIPRIGGAVSVSYSPNESRLKDLTRRWKLTASTMSPEEAIRSVSFRTSILRELSSVPAVAWAMEPERMYDSDCTTDDEDFGSLASIATGTAREELLYTLQKLVSLCNKTGRRGDALTYLAELRREFPKSISWRVEEAKGFWKQGEKMRAISFVDALDSSISAAGETACLRSNVRRLRGKWLAKTGSGSATVVRACFEDALTMCSDLQSSPPQHLQRIHYNFACYLDRMLRATKSKMESAEWKLLEQLETDNKRAMEIRKTSSRRSENIDRLVQRSIRARQRFQEEDKSRRQMLVNTLDDLVASTAYHYLRYLQSGRKHSLRASFRVIAVWFDVQHDVTLNQLLERELPKVPSYHFIPLSYQIVSRLKGSEGPFFSNLRSFIVRLCIRHPHHALYPVLALSNSNNLPASKKARALVNSEKMAAANDILREVRKARPDVIDGMKHLFGLYLKLAYEDSQEKSRPNTRFDMPRYMRKPLEGLESVLVPTVSIEVSVNGEYPNFPYPISFDPHYEVPGGVTRPKKITVLASDGHSYTQLVKGNEDTRQDAVMEQVFGVVNVLLRENLESQRRRLSVKTYKVVPLSPQGGILEWVPNTMPLSEYLQGKSGFGAHQRYRPNDLPPTKCRLMMKAAQEKHVGEKRLDAWRREFDLICSRFQPVFHHFFTENFSDPQIWYSRRRCYVRSVAVSSIVGYIVGLGDRHSSNILIDKLTAEVVHIDHGIAFEQGKLLRFPETVPFRLTRDIVDGFGVAGCEGPFRRSCETAMHVLRDNTDAVLTLLKVFIDDPLYNWRIPEIELAGRQKHMSRDSESDGDDVQKGGKDSNGQDRGQLNQEAERMLLRIRQKLVGDVEGEILSVEGHVTHLIQEATDPGRLCQLFHGWAAWM